MCLSFTGDCNDRQSICKPIYCLRDQIKQFLYVSLDKLLVLREREKHSIVANELNVIIYFPMCLSSSV